MCYFEIILIVQGFVVIYLMLMYFKGSSLRQKLGINGKSIQFCIFWTLIEPFSFQNLDKNQKLGLKDETKHTKESDYIQSKEYKDVWNSGVGFTSEVVNV